MKKSFKITIAAAAPAAAVLLLIFREWIFKISETFPKCIFFVATGYHCPACGNTRCVRALMRGDILTALHNNITPVLLLFLLAVLYIELLLDIFGKKVKLLPRKLAFWLVVIGIVTVYYVARNFIEPLAPLAE
ncbi:MAG: DUF2752 domain-containing protein [Porcipelethomonas sp.]